MSLEPSLEDFRRAHEAGRPQLVWRRIVDDLETPVSAYLKIAKGEPYAFLFESVEGGAWRGRYSVIALRPELVWRCRGDQAETASGADIAAARTPRNGFNHTPSPDFSGRSIMSSAARAAGKSPAFTLKPRKHSRVWL